jgi:formylglycine-generating enzyme required for sulfatase activity
MHAKMGFAILLAVIVCVGCAAKSAELGVPDEMKAASLPKENVEYEILRSFNPCRQDEAYGADMLLKNQPSEEALTEFVLNLTRDYDMAVIRLFADKALFDIDQIQNTGRQVCPSPDLAFKGKVLTYNKFFVQGEASEKLKKMCGLIFGKHDLEWEQFRGPYGLLYGTIVRFDEKGNQRNVIKIPQEEVITSHRSHNDIPVDYISIRPGSFQMGCRRMDNACRKDQQKHAVTITKAFLIKKTEITVGEFREFVSATGYQTDAEKDGSCEFFGEADNIQSSGSNWGNLNFDQADSHPVVCVSWNDAIAYANWLSEQRGLSKCYNGDKWDQSCTGYRLPTEAEWEYAGRGGLEGMRYPWGDGYICGKMNYCEAKCPSSWNHTGCDDGFANTAPVGSFEANGFGLHDMSGNVWEWTWDWYEKVIPEEPVTNPIGPSTGQHRTIRGGGWESHPYNCRLAKRQWDVPAYRSNFLGFRLVVGE